MILTPEIFVALLDKYDRNGGGLYLVRNEIADHDTALRLAATKVAYDLLAIVKTPTLENYFGVEEKRARALLKKLGVVS